MSSTVSNSQSALKRQVEDAITALHFTRILRGRPRSLARQRVKDVKICFNALLLLALVCTLNPEGSVWVE